MKYNFDEPVDRSQNRSAKYDERVKNFGTDDVIPLWIADMDCMQKESGGRDLGLYLPAGQLL